MDAKIRLLASYAEHCHADDSRRSGDGAGNNPGVFLHHDVVYDELNQSRFDAVFTLKIVQPNFVLDMTYRTEFEAESAIDDDFKKGPFPNVNAPAIAYPLLRAAVAAICINLFNRPIVLPVLNFQELNKNNAAKAEEAKKPE